MYWSGKWDLEFQMLIRAKNWILPWSTLEMLVQMGSQNSLPKHFSICPSVFWGLRDLGKAVPNEPNRCYSLCRRSMIKRCLLWRSIGRTLYFDIAISECGGRILGGFTRISCISERKFLIGDLAPIVILNIVCFMQFDLSIWRRKWWPRRPRESEVLEKATIRIDGCIIFLLLNVIL